MFWILSFLVYLQVANSLAGDGKIIGGMQSDWNRTHPSFAFLWFTSNGLYECGGVVVGIAHVMTAGTCLLDENYKEIKADQFRVRAGKNYVRPDILNRADFSHITDVRPLGYIVRKGQVIFLHPGLKYELRVNAAKLSRRKYLGESVVGLRKNLGILRVEIPFSSEHVVPMAPIYDDIDKLKAYANELRSSSAKNRTCYLYGCGVSEENLEAELKRQKVSNKTKVDTTLNITKLRYLKLRFLYSYWSAHIWCDEAKVFCGIEGIQAEESVPDFHFLAGAMAEDPTHEICSGDIGGPVICDGHLFGIAVFFVKGGCGQYGVPMGIATAPAIHELLTAAKAVFGSLDGPSDWVPLNPVLPIYWREKPSK